MRRLILLLLLCEAHVLNAQEYYYYYNGEKIIIEKNEKDLYLSSSDEECMKRLRNKFGLNYYEFDELRFNRNCQIEKQMIRYESFFNIEQLTPRTIEDIQKEQKTIVEYSYIVKEDTIYSSAYFYVCLYSIEDFDILQQYSKENGVRIVSQDKYLPEWFTLAVTEICPINTVEIANRFYESGYFKYAEPDWRMNLNQQSNDPYYSDQWGLRNTGQHNGQSGMDINIEPAWNISKGSNIIVAVIDKGIELTHSDLSSNIYSLSYDAENNNLGSTLYGVHGTNCAGIIGAIQNNNLGVAGVAPQCQLMSVSLSLHQSAPTASYVNAINWAVANGADILSNSWRYPCYSSYIESAINNAVTNGRNGLGSIVLFSSGNAIKKNSISYEDDTYVRFPASLSSTIAVGAMSPCGERKTNNSCDGEKWKSCFGTELDIVAPGVLVPTTTINSDYVTNFNGTSAACPHAAGVMALILSVNPCLTATEARAILCKSCDKLPDYQYCNSTYGLWNPEVGYGRINAYKAVLMALGLVYENQITGNVGQPSATLQWQLSNSGNTGLATGIYYVQRYEVTQTITFPYMENPVVLVSTNGYSANNSPNNGMNYCSISNVTHTSATLKTWKYKIISNSNGQTNFPDLPNCDVVFSYFIYDETEPVIYVTNKIVNSTTYHQTAIEDLNISNFGVMGNSNVELRAGNEIIFSPTTYIKPTSTGIVHAKAEPFVSCESNRELQNETSDGVVYESMLKAFNEGNISEDINNIEENISPVVLFPNPAKDEIIVQYNKSMDSRGIIISISSSSGKCIDEIKSNNVETPINISHYANGYYIVKVMAPDGVYRKSFLKK